MRRVNALAFGVPGLADVAEAQLHYQKEDPDRPGETLSGDVTDPFLIAQTEVVRPDGAALRAVLLRGWRVPGSPRAIGGGSFEVDLELVDATGAAVTFADLALDLDVTLRARLLAAPDQPPQRIGSFTRQVRFDDASVATLTIGPADTAGFRAGEHDPAVEVLVSAAAYPGLQGAATTINLP